MSKEDAGNKSFEATPDRIRKARQKGDVAISTDVAVFASYAGCLLGLLLAGRAAFSAAEALSGVFNAPEAVAGTLLRGGGAGLSAAGFAPVGAIVLPAAALVVAGIFAQQAFVFAPSKLKPALSKIHPVENAKKKYGGQGLGEFARSAIKITAVACLGSAYLWSRRDGYLAATGLHAGMLPGMLRGELFGVLGLAALVAALVAGIGFPLRRMQHARRLRMTRQEVQDENKENEGDPTQKQNRKKRAGEIARNQMLRDTAEADVVLVNPTHYAVALKWDRRSDTVPVCVAKGVDHLALAIRQRAELSGVPVREDVSTARALHAAVEVGETIRPEHYAAVAAAIRFAEAIRRRSGRASA
ncbi:EscU/YscU/HrcU family type III secretion system export apparatus switch protein [Parvularcula oceani]|uniref:EscU/YscU/HrcU family type III secretion system export apparatus switch protein n=1 Tax=Parvularcula oceani TaxID=1247963 RepID=UPI0004E12B90|nr:EscU/YscU/HrcU family type III secretion system export apparatus switch protein [Parvularcula oceani]